MKRLSLRIKDVDMTTSCLGLGLSLGLWVWLRSAELLEHGLKLQEMFASRVKLERRLIELAIMLTARLTTAQFAWDVHERHALRFGISPNILKAISERRTPVFHREDERVVYDITMELKH